MGLALGGDVRMKMLCMTLYCTWLHSWYQVLVGYRQSSLGYCGAWHPMGGGCPRAVSHVNPSIPRGRRNVGQHDSSYAQAVADLILRGPLASAQRPGSSKLPVRNVSYFQVQESFWDPGTSIMVSPLHH